MTPRLRTAVRDKGELRSQAFLHCQPRERGKIHTASQEPAVGPCHPSPFAPSIPLWGLSHSCTDFFAPGWHSGSRAEVKFRPQSADGIGNDPDHLPVSCCHCSQALHECPVQPPAAPPICISPHKPLQHCFLCSFQASLNLDSLLSKTSQSSKTQRKDSLLQGASLKPRLPLELPSAPVLSSLPPTERTQSICLPR